MKRHKVPCCKDEAGRQHYKIAVGVKEGRLVYYCAACCTQTEERV